MDERPALASVGELAHWTLGARVEDLRGESLKGAGREALEVRHRERAILPAGLCDEGRGDLRMQRERILQIAEDGIARWGNDFESSLTRPLDSRAPSSASPCLAPTLAARGLAEQRFVNAHCGTVQRRRTPGRRRDAPRASHATSGAGAMAAPSSSRDRDVSTIDRAFPAASASDVS